MLLLSNDQQINHLALATPQRVHLLGDEDKAETLQFLSARPDQTFLMSGWMKDNGLVSPLNRGEFYGYRNERGQLEGVALVGHISLFETQAEEAVAAFASLTQWCPFSFALVGEERQVSRFRSYYSESRTRPRLICRELLFEQQEQQQLDETVPGLRLATSNELDLVVKVHAEMAHEETGVNPLDVDPMGFRHRCARRIYQDRVWVVVKDNELAFKADVITDLPEVTYLEGVYVNPERRGNGFGACCVKQLSNKLLERSESICLLIKEQNAQAQACYRKAGYKMREYYETLFFNQN